MKHIYLVELWKKYDFRIVGIWYFTTMKRAIEYGEYKYRTEPDIEHYRIITADANPEWYKLSNPYYSKI